MDDFADTCVFAKQSLGPILCGPLRLEVARTSHLLRAPLLPKLRGHFAEFLLHGSLEHLRLLASPTCVGLRYGRMNELPHEAFPGGQRREPFAGPRRPLRRPVSRISRCFIPDPRYPVASAFHSPTVLLLPRPPLRSNALHPARESSPVSHRLRLSASA